MTAPDGFPPDTDPFALDAGTAERLVTGAVDVDDAPPQYRAVAATLSALRNPPESSELVGAPAAAERIAAAVVSERAVRPARRSRRSTSRGRVLTACVAACGLVVTGGLAAAGALPDSAQRVASAVLGQVGISVPSGDEDSVDHQPPPATSAPVTTAGSMPLSPFGVSAEIPSPAPDDASPTSPRRVRQADLGSPPPPDAPPLAVTDDVTKQTTADSPPGNGNGNAYGVANGNGNGNANGAVNAAGNGNGNGNAYGHGNADGDVDSAAAP
jgi:hypothetical protein